MRVWMAELLLSMYQDRLVKTQGTCIVATITHAVRWQLSDCSRIEAPGRKHPRLSHGKFRVR